MAAPSSDVATDQERLRRSKVFCIAPWTHLHVLTDGKVYPCCVSGYDTANAVGDLKAGATLESAWNSPRMRTLRRNMLEERPSKLCERCYFNEDLGLDSFRTIANRDKAHHVGWVALTDAEGRLEELHLPYLDLRISNFCNLKCRICAHMYSSSWHRDSVRLGLTERDAPRHVAAFSDSEELWRQLRPLIPGFEHLHFAGGEPLLMPEQYRIVEELLALGKTGVRLSYNTNFSFLRFKHHDAVSLWQQFSDVYVSASLDGMGARGEYMRKGEKWSWVEANRERLQRECPHVDFQVSATVSLMNAQHLPDFFRDWHERGWVALDRFKMSLLFDPEYYDVRGLPPDLKRRVEDRYEHFIATYLGPLGEGAAGLVQNFRAILGYMNECDLEVAEPFRQATKALDLLRGESFALTFPELAGFVAPTPADDLLQCCRARCKLGDAAGGSRDLEQALRIDPRHPGARTLRGTLRKEQGDADGALADFECALEGDPEALEARLGRAVLLRDRGRYADALEDFRRILQRLDALPGDVTSRVQALAERGRTRRLCEDLPGALQDLDRALELAPEGAQGAQGARAFVLTERGVVERRLGDLAGALRDHEEAVARDPRSSGARIERGHTRRLCGDLAGALADYEHALRTAPRSHHPLILSSRAEIRRALGDHEGSLDDVAQSVALMPQQALLYLDPALAALERGEGPWQANATALLDPGHPLTPSLLRYARGVARRQLGRLDEAAEDFARALELLPAADAALGALVERLRRPDRDPLAPHEAPAPVVDGGGSGAPT